MYTHQEQMKRNEKKRCTEFHKRNTIYTKWYSTPQTVIVVKVNTHLSQIDKSSGQKLNGQTYKLNLSMNLTYVQRTFHSNTK